MQKSDSEGGPGKCLECIVLHCEQCRILSMSRASFI